MEEGKSTIPPPEVVSEKEDLEDHEMVKLDLDFNKIETLGGRKNKPHWEEKLPALRYTPPPDILSDSDSPSKSSYHVI
jgi:hypothetical protein